MNAKVAIVGPWWRPIPPVLNGAPEWLIYYSVQGNLDLDAVVISPWHKKLSQFEYDASRFIHVRSGFFLKLARLLPKTILRVLIGTGNLNALTYKKGLKNLLRRQSPKLVIVHVLAELVETTHRILPEAKIVYFHYGNLLYSMPPESWQNLLQSIVGLVANSRRAIEDAERQHGPISVPTCVIYGAVDTELFHPKNRLLYGSKIRTKLGCDNNPLIAYVGRLTPGKGVHLLIEAFKGLLKIQPQAKLLIIGAAKHECWSTDAYVRDLHRLAQGSADNSIHFLGYIPNQELPYTLATADVGVVPSVEEEGMPSIILEYMASGVPVIATNVGGISEAVVQRRTGLLIERDSLKMNLELAMKEMITDEKLRRRCGEEGRRIAEERFNLARLNNDTAKMVRFFQLKL